MMIRLRTFSSTAPPSRIRDPTCPATGVAPPAPRPSAPHGRCPLAPTHRTGRAFPSAGRDPWWRTRPPGEGRNPWWRTRPPGAGRNPWWRTRPPGAGRDRGAPRRVRKATPRHQGNGGSAVGTVPYVRAGARPPAVRPGDQHRRPVAGVHPGDERRLALEPREV